MTRKEKEQRLQDLGEQKLQLLAELAQYNDDISAAVDTLFDTGDLELTLGTIEGQRAKVAAGQRVMLRIQIDSIIKEIGLLENVDTAENINEIEEWEEE